MAYMMLAGMAQTPPDVKRRLVLEDGTGVSIVGVIRHDAVELRLRYGQHSCHEDGRKWGEVPLYLAQP